VAGTEDAVNGAERAPGATGGQPATQGDRAAPGGAQRALEAFRRAVRDAVTYSADDGTCGWLLSEEQFQRIFGAGEEFAAACVELWARPPGKRKAR
jgi:hypothetical protein